MTTGEKVERLIREYKTMMTDDRRPVAPTVVILSEEDYDAVCHIRGECVRTLHGLEVIVGDVATPKVGVLL